MKDIINASVLEATSLTLENGSKVVKLPDTPGEVITKEEIEKRVAQNKADIDTISRDIAYKTNAVAEYQAQIAKRTNDLIANQEALDDNTALLNLVK